MAETVSQPRLFYLGIGGDQKGPFTEDEIKDQIGQQRVPPDALIWYDGLASWQPINTLNIFSGLFDSVSKSPKNREADRTVGATVAVKVTSEQSGIELDSKSQEKPSSTKTATIVAKASPSRSQTTMLKPSTKNIGTFAEDSAALKLVFDVEEGTLSKPIPRQKWNLKLLAMGVGVIVAVVGTLYLITVFGPVLMDLILGSLKTEKNKISVRAQTPEREKRYREASSNLLLKADKAVEDLTRLILEEPADSLSNQALQDLLNYYRQRKRSSEAGKLLMKVGKPEEAISFFLKESQPSELQQAYFVAYENTQDAHSKIKYLTEDIHLLIGPLQNQGLAVQHIRVLQSLDAKAAGPFDYYLKSDGEKIADIFERISFFFVQGLLNYLNTEFPQIQFLQRPKVAIVKEDSGYRISANFTGPVLLNRETMPNIHFLFWLIEEQWKVVDTNLTIERQKWARQERSRHQSYLIPEKNLLEYLERVYQQQFPGRGLHESVNFQQSQVSKTVQKKTDE